MPWLHDAGFLALYSAAEQVETGSYAGHWVAPRSYVLLKAVEMTLGLPDGDFVECGVYKGGSALLAAELIHRAPEARRRAFHLFDTFAGIPPHGLTDGEREAGRESWHGDVSLEQVKTNLAPYEEFLRWHPGRIPETLAGFPAGTKVRYLHVDVNTAAAHRDCLEFFVPRLVPGAILVLDDYGFPEYSECKLAVDAFFEEACLPQPLALMTGQGLYLHAGRPARALGF